MPTTNDAPTTDDRLGDIALAVRTLDAHLYEIMSALDRHVTEHTRQTRRVADELAKLNATPQPTPEPGTVGAGEEYGREYAAPKEEK